VKNRNALLLGFASIVMMALPLIMMADQSTPLGASTLPASVAFHAEAPDRFHISVSIPEISHETVNTGEGNFDLFTIADEPLTSREGWPDLPVIVRTILIPPTGRAEVILGDLSSRLEKGFSPVPAPAPEQADYSSANYSRNLRSLAGFWPPNPVEVGEPAILRGYRLLPVRIYPVQYNPSTGETKFNDQIEFGLSFSGHGENEVRNPEKVKPSLYARQIIDGMTLNPPAPQRDDILSGSYLYITPRVNGVDDAVAPLLDWRRRMGQRVAVAQVANNAQIATIGDIIQNAYDSDDPPEFVCLIGDAASSDIVIPAATQTGDYEYTRLDGNDPLPDVAIGRITVANLDQLNHVIDKIVSYETTPYMQNTEWFRRGAVVAGHQGNGLGEILLGKWVQKELLEYGFDEVLDWFWNVDGEMPANHQFLTNTFQEGISILHYRAYSHMNLIPLQVLTNLPNDEGMWPAVLAISCNTGNFVSDQNGDYRNIGLSEEFLRANGGGIGAIGTATGETNVRFNNLVAGGVWLGVYRYQQYCLGWGLVSGKYQIWRAYEGFDNTYMNFMDWNNLMGDPGTPIWTDIPMRIEVAHRNSVPLGTTRFDVEVINSFDDTSLEGAQVCLWKGDEIHAVEITDETGFAHFTIAPDALTAGVMKLTVVKHNVHPYLADVTIAQPPQQLLGVQGWSIDDDAAGESRGDDNGIANAGEIIELRMMLKNLGQTAIQEQVALTAESIGDWGEVIDGPENIDQPPTPGDSTELVYVIQVNSACPDLEIFRVSLDIEIAQAAWQAIAQFEVRSPKIEVSRVIIEGDTLIRGDVKYLDLELENIGAKTLNNSTVSITTSSPFLSAINASASYSRIPAGEARRAEGALFRIRAHPFATPGSVATLIIDIQDESGFRSQTAQQIVIGSPGARDPFGPDYYGYICYDSGDTSWNDRPTYEWIEISNNGSRLNLNDQGDNQDRSVVVNLPFVFRYYGQNFNRITVCSNGWAAFGEQADLANFRNQHIGEALCPNAMLCPWWDNLIVPNGAGIFTRYDQQAGRFVIQWNNVQRLVEGAEGSRETFEIVLYNQQARPTQTGDGEVLFQYRDIDNQDARAHNDIPFCTIGITGLDGLDGLEYTYWNTYVTGARTIADQMAIRFTTGSPFITGVVEGRVTDVETGQPLQGVQVISSNGFWSESNADGIYQINDIVVSNDFSLTAAKQGYCDSTLTGFDIARAETLRVDFNLLHPEFRLSEARIDAHLIQGDSVENALTLSNAGNGPLIWSTSKSVIVEDAPEPWQLLQSLHLGQTVNDDRIEGAVLIGDLIYAAGANAADPSAMYIFNLEGEQVGEWQQQGASAFGMKDLAWDGEWIWGGEDDTMYAYTPDGEPMTHWRGPFNPNNDVAWDSDRGLLWIANSTSNIEAFTRDGQRTGRVIRRILDRRIYGLAYNPEDPEGKGLYILFRPSVAEEANRWLVYRINPDGGEFEFFKELTPPEGGQTSGISITNDYDPLSWTMLAMANTPVAGGRDRLDIYHLQSRTEWMNLDPASGVLTSDESIDLSLSLNTLDLPAIEVNGSLTFLHNATGGKTILPIVLTIRGGEGALEARTWTLQNGWNTVSLNINPGEHDIPQLVRTLVDAGQLQLMKDGLGRFYRPAQAFNNIPEYDPACGYLLFMSEAASLDILGRVIAADEPISLPEGWSLISYYPRDPLDVRTAFGNLDGRLIIAKDARGKFYLPALDFSNMSELDAGNGYHVKVTEACEFSYPIIDRRASVALLDRQPTHFTESKIGSESFSLLILTDNADTDWEATAISTSGDIIGSGSFDEQGRCGISLWGREEDADVIGLCDGESFNVRLWNGREEISAKLEPVTGELKWSAGGFAVARVTGATDLPLTFGLENAYPNPFNAQVKINYGLASDGDMKLSVVELSGRVIAVITQGHQSAGRHQAIWNAVDAPSGIYLIRLESEGSVQTLKAALIR